ncbi:galactose-3-O-sulfotransferase 4 isoform X1 [Neophocaena asiaeorientalis asiaeorientalis]|uniref:Galactose-3-O-sulfotransferase 4 n=1 Tax=Neophocaena asiaeorientalis asiaeorientalis TaxID=1706337 RepID=A0A341BHG9_NEOAA|nr:galactose-3-O-sulfotransferase 4 isoform X1 [Neophocaena asiaeorientalis asiaeorientalis]
MGPLSPTRTMRLWGPRSLGVALGVFMTIGFALQLWGGPFQRRLPGLQLRHSWASTLAPAVPSCLPRQRLVFLKTHKSGSSSVLSLLHRYGDRHGLRFALPARYQFGYPKLFQASRVKGYRPQGGGTQSPFHILCHHMRFNLKEVRSVEGVDRTGERWAHACSQDHQGRRPQAWRFPRHPLTQELGMGATKVLQVMPSDSFFFSIVRDPAALARSAFSYYKSTSSAFRKSPSLAAFLDNPRAFYQPGARGDHYARNLLWFDFGLPFPPEMRTKRGNPHPPRDPNPPQLPSGVGLRAHTLDPNALFHPVPTAADGHSQTSSSASLDLRSSSFIQWNLAWLDSVFDLVLVAEYFDESLVLLADALCWGLDDVVGFMHNAQAGGGQGGSAVGDGGLTAEDRQLSARARAWNNLDWALYVHFNRSLWARIKQYGQSRLDSAVAELRARREALAKHCLVGGEALDPKYITDRRFRPFQFGSGKVLGYVLQSGLSLQDQEECERLATPELQYKDKLDAKQFPPTVSVPLKTSRLPSP